MTNQGAFSGQDREIELWDRFSDPDRSQSDSSLSYLRGMMGSQPDETLLTHEKFIPDTVLPQGDDVPKRRPQETPKFGDYQVVTLLGYGGMDQVYRVRHEKNGQEFALKTPRQHDPEANERFERAAKLATQIHHQNVVQAVEWGKSNEGQPFLVMELLDGVDVKKALVQRGSLTIAQACEITRQTAIGLQAIHDHDSVHRDIKPTNLFLTRDGTIKILDFGLARKEHQVTDDKGLTQTFSVMGTPDYVSPEQIQDAKRVDIRSDIYSLGITLFELITSVTPFKDRDNISSKLTAHLSEMPPLLSDAQPQVPRGLVNLVDSMLAKNPRNRPRKPEDVVNQLKPYAKSADLKELVGESSLGSDAPTLTVAKTGSSAEWRAKRKRRRFLAIGVCMAAALVLIVTSANLAIKRWWPNPIKIEQFAIQHYRHINELSEPTGLLGEGVFEVRPQDRLQLAAKLSRPGYSYLISFRPDGEMEICSPDDESVAPEMTETPRYPTLDHSDKSYALTDGSGLQVFAIVASSQPLPAFRQWIGDRDPSLWHKDIVGPASVVWGHDGQWLLTHTAANPDGRGKEEGLSRNAARKKIEELYQWLAKKPGVDAIQIKGFIVP